MLSGGGGFARLPMIPHQANEARRDSFGWVEDAPRGSSVTEQNVSVPITPPSAALSACYRLKKKTRVNKGSDVHFNVCIPRIRPKRSTTLDMVGWLPKSIMGSEPGDPNLLFSDKINDELLERQPVSCQKASAGLGTLFGYSSPLAPPFMSDYV